MMSPYLLLWVTTSLLMGGIIQSGLAMNLNRYQGNDKQELDYDEVTFGNKTVINKTTHQNVTGGSAFMENLDASTGEFFLVCKLGLRHSCVLFLAGSAAPRTRIDEVVIRTGEAMPGGLPRSVLTTRPDDFKSSANAGVTTSDETPAETSPAPSTPYPEYDRVDEVEQGEPSLHDGRVETYVVELVTSCSAIVLFVIGGGVVVKFLTRRRRRSQINRRRGLRQTGPNIELPSVSLARAVSEVNEEGAENLNTIEAAKKLIQASRETSDFFRSELRVTGSRGVDNYVAARRSLRKLDHCTERAATTIELRSASGASAYGVNAEPYSDGVLPRLGTVRRGTGRFQSYGMPSPMDPPPQLPSWEACEALHEGIDLCPRFRDVSLESFKTPEMPRTASSGGVVDQCNGYVEEDAGSRCSLCSGEPEEGARHVLAQVEETSSERGEKSKAVVFFMEKPDEGSDEDYMNPE